MVIKNNFAASTTLLDFLACLLIILCHFANYIIYAGYSRMLPDILIIFGTLCLVALLLTLLLRLPLKLVRAFIFALLVTMVVSDAIFTFGFGKFSAPLAAFTATLVAVWLFAFFLHHHLTKVLCVAFGTMLVSTALIGVFESAKPATSASRPDPKSDDARPIIVHLILDEHMGGAGMTDALTGSGSMGQTLREFYARSGFRLFGRAYSQYYETAPSLAGATNFYDGQFAKRFMAKKRNGYALTQNAYLKSYSDRGYLINVYQSAYLDFCDTPEVNIAKCFTYKPNNLKSSEIYQLPLAQRVKLVHAMYFNSFSIIKLLKRLEAWLVARSRERGEDFTGFALWRGSVGPLAISTGMDQLLKDISRSKGGTVFFAHFLLPHHPYVYAPRCEVRSPISSWMRRWLLADRTNSNTSRQQRYAQYFDQLHCTMQKLRHLFETMKKVGTFRNAVIVIHGDHGARISLSAPNAGKRGKLTVTDAIDGFSTLFAIKAPTVPAGDDQRMLPLAQLLQYSATFDGRHLSSSGPPTVYLYKSEFDYLPASLPRFPMHLK